MSEDRRSRKRPPARKSRVERWLIVTVMVGFVALPIFFFMSGPGRSLVEGFEQEKSERQPGRLSEREERVPDFIPEHVSVEAQEAALDQLDRLVTDFDLAVRNVEQRRLSGQLRTGNEVEVLLGMLAPARREFVSGLKSAGTSIGFLHDDEKRVFHRSPILEAFHDAHGLPEEIEATWRRGEGLSELSAREELRRSQAAARRWIEGQ